jgi:hypothetical protein
MHYKKAHAKDKKMAIRGHMQEKNIGSLAD